MALAIDASTPAAKHSANDTTAALASNSFSPPAGSVIFLFWAADSNSAFTPTTPTITDSLGSHLTWNLVQWSTKADTGAGNAEAAIWYANCPSAQTGMTVTVTNNLGGSTNSLDAHIAPVVFTGADTTQNGATGKGGSASNTGTATYTSTRAGSQGFIVFGDWNASSSHPTLQAACTEQNWTTLATSSTGWTVRQTSTVGSSGTSVTIGASAPTVEGRFAYVEVLPSVSVTLTYPPQRPVTRRAVPLRVARTRQTAVVPPQIVEAGTTGYTTANTATITTGSFTPADNTLLVAYCSMGNGAGTASSLGTVTDSLSGTWTRLAGDASATGGVAEIWCRDIAVGAAMTVTYDPGGAGASGLDIICKWYRGAAPRAQQPGATAALGGTTAYTLAITTTKAGSIVAGAFGRATDAQSLTANAATTILGKVNGTSGDTAGLFRAASQTGTPASTTLGFTNAAAGANRMALAEILPTVAVAATATYPPQRPATRRAVPLRVAKSRQTVPVPPQLNPPFPFAEVHQARAARGWLLRRGKLAQPVRPQANPPFPFAEAVQPRRTRGLLPRRGRQAWPVPAQDAPVVENDQARRLRGIPVRRGRNWVPAPPQVNPPFPWAEIVQPRRLRGLLLRRGKLAAAPPQLDQLAPVQENDQPRRLRGFLLRRGKLAQTVPPQLNPPFPFTEVAQPRRPRGLLGRRGKLAQPVSAQVVLTPPPYVPQALRSRVKTYRLFRGKQAQVVPAQQAAPQAPAFVPDRIRARVRLWPLRRGRDAQPVPAQDTPVQARSVRRPCPVHGRPRLAVPPLAQAAPVPAKQARRPLLAALRRGAKALLPLKQAVPPANPPFVPSPGRHRLAFLPLARRGHITVPPICSCHTARPAAGTTARPSTGTTAYATATTGRPSAGTTARPSTGTTKDPCC